MRSYLISDNRDTLVGMRLAGIEGVVVHERAEVLSALKTAIETKDTAVVIITEKLARLCPDQLREIKEKVQVPLLVTIPDRHGGTDLTASISKYLSETIGIRI